MTELKREGLGTGTIYEYKYLLKMRNQVTLKAQLSSVVKKSFLKNKPMEFVKIAYV